MQLVHKLVLLESFLCRLLQLEQEKETMTEEKGWRGERRKGRERGEGRKERKREGRRKRRGRQGGRRIEGKGQKKPKPQVGKKKKKTL